MLLDGTCNPVSWYNTQANSKDCYTPSCHDTLILAMLCIFGIQGFIREAVLVSDRSTRETNRKKYKITLSEFFSDSIESPIFFSFSLEISLHCLANTKDANYNHSIRCYFLGSLDCCITYFQAPSRLERFRLLHKPQKSFERFAMVSTIVVKGSRWTRPFLTHRSAPVSLCMSPLCPFLTVSIFLRRKQCVFQPTYGTILVESALAVVK